MLPVDLLRYKLDNKNYKIYPVLCSVEQNSKDIELASQIIQTFDYCYNHKIIKEKLDESLRALEITYKDYKLVRGLATVLERRCIFKPLSQPYFKDNQDNRNDSTNYIQDTNGLMKNLSAIEIRRIVFDESARKGIAINENKRKLLLQNISNSLKTSPHILSKLMWSDLNENAIIDVFLSLEPDKLLLTYNISLIQTLLFGCLKMKLVLDVISSAGTLWKEVLREVKRLGLMYWLDIENSEQQDEKESNGQLPRGKKIVCTIEGALNVLKLTDRYGNAIAKIFPIILTSERWTIKADILRITNSGKKIVYEFEITQDSYPHSIPSSVGFNIYENYIVDLKSSTNQSPSLVKPDSSNKKYSGQNLNKVVFDKTRVHSNIFNISKILFDSKIESKFQEQFELFQTGWKIEREPEPIITKQKTAFIPDFVLSKFNYQIIVEIIGFWTKEYLERKLSKIYDVIQNKSKEERFFMILIINHENLMSYEITDNQRLNQVKGNSNVLITSYKKDKILFKDIILFLKGIENDYLNDEFLNDSGQSVLIQNVSIFLKKFKDSEMNIVSISNLEGFLKKEQSDNNFLKIMFKDLVDKNIKFKKQFNEELINNQLLMINDFLLKEKLVKEILNEVKDKATVREASVLMTSKGLPERIHIDLLTFLGFNIEWNSLDFSNAKIYFRE
jgi:predicted nuclease of restriction endonuclease-like RecB superfamily